MTEQSDYCIREAKVSDSSILARHHLLMFQEISQADKTASEWRQLEEIYQQLLIKQLHQGTCIGVLIAQQNEVIASGVTSIIEQVPTPYDLNTQIGHVHSIYTDVLYRQKGYAGMILKQLITSCREKGIRRFELKTSSQGRSLYEKIGFKDNGGMSFIYKEK